MVIEVCLEKTRDRKNNNTFFASVVFHSIQLAIAKPFHKTEQIAQDAIIQPERHEIGI